MLSEGKRKSDTVGAIKPWCCLRLPAVSACPSLHPATRLKIPAIDDAPPIDHPVTGTKLDDADLQFGVCAQGRFVQRYLRGLFDIVPTRPFRISEITSVTLTTDTYLYWCSPILQVRPVQSQSSHTCTPNRAQSAAYRADVAVCAPEFQRRYT
jgi:hypothetical protein